VRRFALLIAVLIFIALPCRAQYSNDDDFVRKTHPAFEDGYHYVSLTYGFVDLYITFLANNVVPMTFRHTLTSTISHTGPLFLKYEHPLNSSMSVGGVIGYGRTDIVCDFARREQVYDPAVGAVVTKSLQTHIDYYRKSLSIGMRFNQHFGKSKLVDPYLGVAAGMSLIENRRVLSTDDPNVKSYEGIQTLPEVPLYVGFTAGLRLYFSEQFGIQAELGVDKWALVQVGCVFKL
jgi:hypothetical protein